MRDFVRIRENQLPESDLFSDLFSDFSFGLLIASAAFILGGYLIVYWTHQLSEVGEAIRTGRLVVAPEGTSN